MCFSAYADTVTVKSGRVLEGIITAESRRAIRIEVDGVRITVPKSQIARIDYSKRPIPLLEAGSEKGTAAPGAVPAVNKGKGAAVAGKTGSAVGPLRRSLVLSRKNVVPRREGPVWGESVDRIENGLWHLRGTIYNPGDRPMRNVRVTVSVFDRYGNKLTSASAYASPATIVTNQRAYYDICMPYDSRISNYKTDCSWE